MTSAVLVLFLASMALCMPDPASFRKRHEEHVLANAQKLQAVSALAQESIKNLGKMQLQDATTDCYAAMEQFQAIWNSSTSNCQVVTGVFDNTTTSAELDQIVTDYCVTQTNGQTCQQAVNSAFTEVVTKCYQAGVVNTSQVEAMRGLLAASTITCLHDDNDATHFCIHDFKVLSSTQTLSADTLAVICTACTKKVINALFIFAPKDTLSAGVYLDLVCYKEKDQFCWVKFNAMSDQATPGFTPEKLDALCDHCVAAFLYRYVAVLQFLNGESLQKDLELASLLAFRGLVCVKDWKTNEYCINKITAAAPAFETLGAKCGPELLSNTTCVTCHDQLQSVAKDLDCCFGTWFNLLNWQYVFDNANYTLPAPPDQIRAFVSGLCGTTIPYGCSQQKIELALTIGGVNLAWIWANEQLVKDSFVAYLIYRLAVDASAVRDLAIVQGTPSTKSANGYQLLDANSFTVTGTVLPGDNTQAGDVKTLGQNTASDTSAVNNPWSAGWALNARADPSTIPFVAQSTATSVSISGANVVSPTYSLAIIAISIVALLFV